MKKQFVFLLCLGLLPVTTASAQVNRSDVIQANNEGVKALSKKNYFLAIELFKKATAMDPEYKLAKENLAHAYNEYGLTQKSPKEALKYYHKALVLAPGNYSTRNNIDSTIQKLGKDPKAFFDRVELAEFSENDGEYEDAVLEYKEALKLKDDAKTHESLADVLVLANEPGEAIAEYEKAKGLMPSSQLEGKIRSAHKFKEDSYKAPNYTNPIDPKSLDAVQSSWENKLKKDPLSVDNHVGLGTALEMRGDIGGAAAEYKTALQMAKGHSIEEIATIQRRIDYLPGHICQQAMLDAISLFAAKKYDLAISSFQKIIAGSGKEETARKAEAYLYIGNAYLQKGQLSQAKVFYENAWKEDRYCWGLTDAHKDYLKAVESQKKNQRPQKFEKPQMAPPIEDLYRRVAALESKVFNTKYGQDNIETRVTRLESQLSLPKESSSLTRRITALEEKTKQETEIPYEQLPQFNKALTHLEQINFGKTYADEDTASRISRLELKLKGKLQTGSLLTRLDSLLILN